MSLSLPLVFVWFGSMPVLSTASWECFPGIRRDLGCAIRTARPLVGFFQLLQSCSLSRDIFFTKIVPIFLLKTTRGSNRLSVVSSHFKRTLKAAYYTSSIVCIYSIPLVRCVLSIYNFRWEIIAVTLFLDPFLDPTSSLCRSFHSGNLQRNYISLEYIMDALLVFTSISF